MLQASSQAFHRYDLIFSLQHPLEAGMVIIPILWVRKLRLRELSVVSKDTEPECSPLRI